MSHTLFLEYSLIVEVALAARTSFKVHPMKSILSFMNADFRSHSC